MSRTTPRHLMMSPKPFCSNMVLTWRTINLIRVCWKMGIYTSFFRILSYLSFVYARCVPCRKGTWLQYYELRHFVHTTAFILLVLNTSEMRGLFYLLWKDFARSHQSSQGMCRTRCLRLYMNWSHGTGWFQWQLKQTVTNDYRHNLIITLKHPFQKKK